MQCFANADCPAAEPVCTRDFECRAGCSSDAQCTAPKKCNVTRSECVQCLGDADCAGATGTPFCKDDGKCVQCKADAQCAAPNPICDGDQCVECKKDDDCKDAARPRCKGKRCEAK